VTYYGSKKIIAMRGLTYAVDSTENHYGAKEIIATRQRYMNIRVSVREWKIIQNGARAFER